MKSISLTTLIVALATSIQAQKHLVQIHDHHAFTNVRTHPSAHAKIMFKLKKDQYFYSMDSSQKDWVAVATPDHHKGYVHKAQLRDVDTVRIKGHKYPSSSVKHLKEQQKTIEKTTIALTEISTLDSGYNAWIDVYHNNKLVKTIHYKKAQALGGIAGVEFLSHAIPDYVIVVKHGDSDGKTIYVHKNGTVQETNGGISTQLIDNKYIINFHECDTGYCGYSIFDPKTGRIVASNGDLHITEVYENQGNIILNTAHDGYNLVKLDLKTLNTTKYQTNKPEDLKQFTQYTPYEQEKPCFCNCDF